MKLYGKAEDVAERILEAFKAGTVPAALADVFIQRNDDRPCARWSWSNQFIVALSGHSDARGFRQWQAADRHVLKGSKAVHILVPIVKTTEDTDDAGAKTKKGRLIGFKTCPVFGLSQTDGQPIEADVEAEKWIKELPMLDVARAWGLDVQTFSGKGARFHGFYQHGKRIALGVESLATWAHEMIHAADDRLGKLAERGQHWRSETVAELGGAVLLMCLGLDVQADLGGAWKYIKAYCDRESKDTVGACMAVVKRTCEAVNLILETAEKIAEPAPAVAVA
jgi:antirestriction protein ArdC